MSDHRLDKLDRDTSGAPSITLDEAKEMRTRRWQSDGLVRLPEREDEQGALLVRVPLFSVERVAYFERAGRAVLLFLDRVDQPRVHAPREDHPQSAPVRQSVASRQSQPFDALPLFGSPGCAALDCARPPETVQRVADARAMPLKLVCSSCGGKPKPGVLTLEGGTHYRSVEHGAGIPGRKPSFLAKTCGKWRRA